MKAASYSQQQRQLQLDSPLGKDVLLLQSFEGHERLSTPYRFHLSLLSHETNIDPEKLLAKPISVGINSFASNKASTFHGLVDCFSRHDLVDTAQGPLRHYTASIVPWYALLDYHQECQIFQNKTVPEIFQEVCQSAGWRDFEFKLNKHYPPLTYCTQFNETHRQFLDRILAAAGIGYYFKHADNQHTLVLFDEQSQLPHYQQSIDYSHAKNNKPHFTEVEQRLSLHTQQYTLGTYNFTQAATPLKGKANTKKANSFPNTLVHRQHNIEHKTSADLNQQTKQAMLIDEWRAHQCFAKGRAAGLQAGSLFQLDSQYQTHFSGYYWASSVKHYARDDSYLTAQSANEDNHYRQEIEFVSADYPYCPKRLAKPKIRGQHSAVVTGPSGEPIYTNQYGQVKVLFNWNHKGQANENSSCWLRMMQPIIGAQWGHQFIPRVGQEVMVSFLEGDPDQPIIGETLHHAENKIPYDTASEPHCSGIKSQTLGSNDPESVNELLFDDTPGQELLKLSAQKNCLINVNNQLKQVVGGKHHSIAEQTHFTQVQSGTAEYTAKELHLMVGGNGIVLDQNGITLHGPVTLKASGASDSKPVARVGDQYSCPKLKDLQPHSGGPILKGSPNVHIKGLAIARQDDEIHCRFSNDKIKEGVSGILVNGKPLAHAQHAGEHGGVITSGAPNVSVAPRSGVSAPQPPGTTLPTNTVTPGENWIQAQYLDHAGKPVTDLDYSIITDDGITANWTMRVRQPNSMAYMLKQQRFILVIVKN